ncbi:hypothetical protein TNCV_343571 [Trichonephila clavipes]|nr:hypothetical protein TNCV_343571 [Trichonephila clavipes]
MQVTARFCSDPPKFCERGLSETSHLREDLRLDGDLEYPHAAKMRTHSLPIKFIVARSYKRDQFPKSLAIPIVLSHMGTFPTYPCMSCMTSALFASNGSRKQKPRTDAFRCNKILYIRTATDGSDVVRSGRPIFDDFFQHLWPYIGNNTTNVVFEMVKRLWLIRIDQ